MIKGKGTMFKYDGKCILYIPIIISSDSRFPFKQKKNVVLVSLRGKKIIIEKFNNIDERI